MHTAFHDLLYHQMQVDALEDGIGSMKKALQTLRSTVGSFSGTPDNGAPASEYFRYQSFQGGMGSNPTHQEKVQKQSLPTLPIHPATHLDPALDPQNASDLGNTRSGTGANPSPTYEDFVRSGLKPDRTTKTTTTNDSQRTAPGPPVVGLLPLTTMM